MARPVSHFRGESALLAMMEAYPGSIVAVDGEGRIGYVNPSTQRAFGYSVAELVGRDVEILVPAALAAAHVHHRTRYVADPVPRPMGVGRELVARRKDGSEFPVEISLTAVVCDDGPWFLADVVDVTARRTAAAQLQAAHRSYRMLAHSNEGVVRAASVKELFVSTCRVVVDEGGYLAAWVAQPQPSGDLDMIATAGVLDDDIARLRITTEASDARGRGPVSLALRENRPVYLDDVASPVGVGDAEPDEAGRPPAGVAASASLPLRIRGRAVAVLTLYSERAGVFDEEVRAVLEGMAENVSFGLAGFAAAAELDRTAERSSDLVRRLIRAQEDERSRIAADVHDDSVQTLAVVDLRLGLLLRLVAAQAPGLTEAVTQIQEAVGSVTSGLRLLLFELESGDSGASLPEMLSEAAGVIFEGNDVRWSVEVEAGPELADASRDPAWMPEPARSQIVRVVKEALVNVRKHAGARSVSVTIRPEPDGVEVSVVDDGVGIDSGRLLPSPGHRGLATMRERVEMGGGWSQLDGGPAGTSLRFWMPRDHTGGGRAG